MYVIVVFARENTYEGVPSSWVREKKKKSYCYWPNVPPTEISKMIKKCVNPASSWDLVPVKVKGYASDYADMVEKRKLADSITTTDANETSSGSGEEENASDSEMNPPTPPLPKIREGT